MTEQHTCSDPHCAICTGGEDACDAQTLRHIDQYGFSLIHVADWYPQSPLTYTVGLWESLEVPELLITGLAFETASRLTWDYRDKQANHAGLAPGIPWEGFLQQENPVMFLQVTADGRRHMGQAQWYYRNKPGRAWHDGSPFVAWQLVYPDNQRRWPWDLSTAADFRRIQRLICERP
jgi:hypothetical protein